MNKKRIFQIILISILFILQLPLLAQEQNLDRLLELNLEELMDIDVTTASKTVQKLNEVPATVHVITAEQIKERGYFTLEEALSDLPGMQFRNINGFNSYIFMRGIFAQNQTILLLIDGVQINELNSGGFYGGGQFNLSNVKRIEIVYGPASALYGTNALSGIINIITNDPEDLKNGYISVLTGSFKTRNFDFGYGRYDRRKDVGFSLSGMLKKSNKADLGGVNGDNNWTDDMENFENDYSFDGKIVYKNLKIGAVFHDKQASRTTNYKTIGSNYLDSGTNWHIRFLNTWAKYAFKLNKNWSNQSLLYYRNATVMDNTIAYIKSDTGPTGGQTAYYRPNSLVGLESLFYYSPMKILNLIAGVILEQEKLAEGFAKTFSGSPNILPPVPERPTMMTNELISVFLQTQYRIVNNTELTLGLRRDQSSYYGSVNTPRMGVVYNKNKFTAKMLYMEAFRAPKPWDYTYGDGNPDLEPEIMKSFELSAGYTFTRYFQANLSIYKNHMKNTFNRELQRQTNGPRLDTEGLELNLDYVKDRFKSYVNYTYNYSIYESGMILPEIGRHNANAFMSFNFTGKLQWNIRCNYIGRRKNVKIISATGEETIDDALVLHTVFSLLNIGGFDFQLIGKNVLNVKYYHTSNNPPDRYRQPQRTILIKVEYKI